MDNYEKELAWCIAELENSSVWQSKDTKRQKNALTSLKVLKNPKAAVIKKRQIMRNMFGDYRKKMAEEERKQKPMKLTIGNKTAAVGSSKFLKKATCLSATDSALAIQVEAQLTTTSHCDAKQDQEHSQQTFRDVRADHGSNFRFNFPSPRNIEPVRDGNSDLITTRTDVTSFKMDRTDNSFRFHFPDPS